MSRNGLGTYSRVPGSAYTNGTVNDGSELDAEMNDIATALTDSLTANGEKTWAANQKAGTYKITGMGAGSASTDSANLGQVQAQAYAWLTSVSGTDTIAASASPAITAYAAGQTFRFIPANANTGAVTININGVGAKSLNKGASGALAANTLVTGNVYEITYDGTQFQIISESPVAATARAQYALASQVQDSTLTYLTSVSGTDTLTATAALSMSAYATGQKFHFLAAGANTGAVTLNINGIGAKSVVFSNGDALTAGEISTGQACTVVYDGTNFRLSQNHPAVSAKTAQASTSGTTIDFTGIPSWAKRVTVLFSGVSVSSTNPAKVRIGTSSGLETSGYSGTSTTITATPAGTNFTDGFFIRNLTGSDVFSGSMTLSNITGDTWVVTGTFSNHSTFAAVVLSGTKTLAAKLDRVSVVISGADTFDAGTINVFYE